MKRIGILLIIGAITMIAFYFVYQMSINKKVEEEVNNYIEETSIEEKINIENGDDVVEENKTEQKEINYTAIIEIPKINLKRGVVDSTKNFSSINYAISIDKNSNYPNENGNFILYAHSGNSNIAYFRNLNKVNKNDSIYIYYSGVKYEYKITNKYTIEKTGTANVISSKDKKYLTLITCSQEQKNKQIILVGNLTNEKEY
ncbi:MAG: sortase [Bacilli bacterium]|nr:sortase [Bacilli bacterium]